MAIDAFGNYYDPASSQAEREYAQRLSTQQGGGQIPSDVTFEGPNDYVPPAEQNQLFPKGLPDPQHQGGLAQLAAASRAYDQSKPPQETPPPAAPGAAAAGAPVQPGSTLGKTWYGGNEAAVGKMEKDWRQEEAIKGISKVVGRIVRDIATWGAGGAAGGAMGGAAGGAAAGGGAAGAGALGGMGGAAAGGAAAGGGAAAAGGGLAAGSAAGATSAAGGAGGAAAAPTFGQSFSAGWGGDSGASGMGGMLGRLARNYAQQYGYTPGGEGEGGSFNYMQMLQQMQGGGGGGGGGGGSKNEWDYPGKQDTGSSQMMGMGPKQDPASIVGAGLSILTGDPAGRSWASKIIGQRQQGLSNATIDWA